MTDEPLRPPSLADLPGYLAAQVAKSAARVLSAALAEHDLRPHHFAVLAALDDFGPQCQQDLCDRLDLDKSHMVGFVDHLEDAGHVERTRDPEDRRRHRVAITAAGHRMLAELQAIDRRCHDATFGGLDDADRAELVRLLTAVVRHADAERLPDHPATTPAEVS